MIGHSAPMQSNGTFVDGDTGDQGYLNVRVVKPGVGLTLSLESNGDIEVFLDETTVRRIAAALLSAVTDRTVDKS